MVTIETIRTVCVKDRKISAMPSATSAGTRSTDRLHLDRFVPYRLAVLSNIVSMSIATAYERDFALSIPEWRVVAVLARFPNLSAIEVGERAALDKVAVSRAVRNLVAARRLVRSFDKGDRRRSILKLTQSGKAVYTRVAPRALRYEQKLLGALSSAEQRAFDRLISRLIDRARKID